MSATHLDAIKKRYKFSEIAVSAWRDPKGSILPARGGVKSPMVPASAISKPYVPTYKVRYPPPPEPTDDEDSEDDEDDGNENEEPPVEPAVESAPIDQAAEVPPSADDIVDAASQEPRPDDTASSSATDVAEAAVVVVEPEAPQASSEDKDDSQEIDTEPTETAEREVEPPVENVPPSAPTPPPIADDSAAAKAELSEAPSTETVEPATEPSDEPVAESTAPVVVVVETLDEKDPSPAEDAPEVEVIQVVPSEAAPDTTEPMILAVEVIEPADPIATDAPPSPDKHVMFAPGTPEPKPTTRKKKSAKSKSKGKKKLNFPVEDETAAETFHNGEVSVESLSKTSELNEEHPSTEEVIVVHDKDIMAEETAPESAEHIVVMDASPKDSPIDNLETEDKYTIVDVSNIESESGDPAAIVIVEHEDETPVKKRKKSSKSSKEKDKSKKKKTKDPLPTDDAISAGLGIDMTPLPPPPPPAEVIQAEATQDTAVQGEAVSEEAVSEEAVPEEKVTPAEIRAEEVQVEDVPEVAATGEEPKDITPTMPGEFPISSDEKFGSSTEAVPDPVAEAIPDETSEDVLQALETPEKLSEPEPIKEEIENTSAPVEEPAQNDADVAVENVSRSTNDSQEAENTSAGEELLAEEQTEMNRTKETLLDELISKGAEENVNIDEILPDENEGDAEDIVVVEREPGEEAILPENAKIHDAEIVEPHVDRVDSGFEETLEDEKVVALDETDEPVETQQEIVKPEHEDQRDIETDENALGGLPTTGNEPEVAGNDETAEALVQEAGPDAPEVDSNEDIKELQGEELEVDMSEHAEEAALPEEMPEVSDVIAMEPEDTREVVKEASEHGDDQEAVPESIPETVTESIAESVPESITESVPENAPISETADTMPGSKEMGESAQEQGIIDEPTPVTASETTTQEPATEVLASEESVKEIAEGDVIAPGSNNNIEVVDPAPSLSDIPNAVDDEVAILPEVEAPPSPALSKDSGHRYRADHWERPGKKHHHPEGKVLERPKSSGKRDSGHGKEELRMKDRRRKSKRSPTSPEEEDERNRKREARKAREIARIVEEERIRAEEEELRLIRHEARRAARKAAAEKMREIAREEAEAIAREEAAASLRRKHRQHVKNDFVREPRESIRPSRTSLTKEPDLAMGDSTMAENAAPTSSNGAHSHRRHHRQRTEGDRGRRSRRDNEEESSERRDKEKIEKGKKKKGGFLSSLLRGF